MMMMLSKDERYKNRATAYGETDEPATAYIRGADEFVNTVHNNRTDFNTFNRDYKHLSKPQTERIKILSAKTGEDIHLATVKVNTRYQPGM